MHANPGFVSGVHLPHPDWIYLSLTGGEQGRASEKGSCEGPVSLDKSEVSILQQHGLLVVWGAGGAQVLCDLHGPGDDSKMILVSSTGPGLMTEMIDLAR